MLRCWRVHHQLSEYGWCNWVVTEKCLNFENFLQEPVLRWRLSCNLNFYQNRVSLHCSDRWCSFATSLVEQGILKVRKLANLVNNQNKVIWNWSNMDYSFDLRCSPYKEERKLIQEVWRMWKSTLCFRLIQTSC